MARRNKPWVETPADWIDPSDYGPDNPMPGSKAMLPGFNEERENQRKEFDRYFNAIMILGMIGSLITLGVIVSAVVLAYRNFW